MESAKVSFIYRKVKDNSELVEDMDLYRNWKAKYKYAVSLNTRFILLGIHFIVIQYTRFLLEVSLCFSIVQEI